jgi:hypothetical protein
MPDEDFTLRASYASASSVTAGWHMELITPLREINQANATQVQQQVVQLQQQQLMLQQQQLQQQQQPQQQQQQQTLQPPMLQQAPGPLARNLIKLRSQGGYTDAGTVATLAAPGVYTLEPLAAAQQIWQMGTTCVHMVSTYSGSICCYTVS